MVDRDRPGSSILCLLSVSHCLPEIPLCMRQPIPLSIIRFALLAVLLVTGLPQPVTGQAPPDSVSLAELIRNKARDGGIRVFVRPEWVQGKKADAALLAVAPLPALKSAFEGTDLSIISYEPGLYIVAPLPGSVLLKSTRAFRQQARGGAIILGDSMLYEPGKTVKLQGRVLDFETGRPVPLANLQVKNSPATVKAGEDGRFELQLPSGIYEIDILAAGYEPLKEQIVLWSDTRWEPTLSQAYYELPEVVLESSGADRNLSLPQLGYVRFDASALRSLPALLGQPDVVRVISFLPGISSVGEGAPGFNVRGGSIDQTLVTQDGALIYNTGHVGGVFSVFNTDAVRSTTLMKGHMPAGVGGRLGSALDVTTRNGDLTYWKGQGGIGLLASQFLLEGPIVREKVSVLAGVRGGLADHFLNFVQDLDLREGSARFFDGNIRILARLGEKAELTVGGFSTYDYLRFSQNFGFGWKNDATYANYRLLTGAKSTLLLHASWSRYRAEGFDPAGFDGFSLTNGISNIRLRPVWRLSIIPKHDLSVGGELTDYSVLPEIRTPLSPESRVEPLEVSRDRGRELAFFIQDEFSLGPFIQVSAGIRWSGYQQTGVDTVFSFDPNRPRTDASITGFTVDEDGNAAFFQGWEPRLAVSFRLDELRSLKAGYNRTRQYLHLVSQTQAVTPVDLWQPSTHYLPPQIGDQFTLGYFQNFSSNRFETSVELFYRTMQGLAEPKDLSRLLLNPRMETVLLPAEGLAYGGEVMARKSTGKVTGWVSYAYTRSLRRVTSVFVEDQISDGEWFPSAFDRPHQFNGVFNWRMIRRLSSAMTYTWQSGRPVSAPEAAYFLEGTRFLNYAARNNYRLPSYTRLDLSFTYEPGVIKRQRFKSTFTFSVYNVLSRRNAFSLFYVVKPALPPRAYTLSVLGAALPSVSWNFRF